MRYLLSRVLVEHYAIWQCDLQHGNKTMSYAEGNPIRGIIKCKSP